MPTFLPNLRLMRPLSLNHVFLSTTQNRWSRISLVHILDYILVKHKNIFLYLFTKNWPTMPLLIKSTLSIKNSRRYILWRSKPVRRSLAFKYREARRYILCVLGSSQRKLRRRTVCCWREEAHNSVYCNIHIHSWSNQGCECQFTDWNPNSKWIKSYIPTKMNTTVHFSINTWDIHTL